MQKRTGARAAATLVAACTLLAACGTSGTNASSAHSSPAVTVDDNYGYGSIPPQHGTPAQGGTVTIAEVPGAGPTYIFPIVPGAQESADDVDNFIQFSWRPLWWTINGVSPTLNPAESIAAGAPKFTDNNKTATITLKSNWKWSDGTPVTAQDVVFYYWLLKGAVKLSPANSGNYTPGLFPDNVTSITAPNPTTVVVKFNKSYNRNFAFFTQLGLMYPLPAQAWSKTSANGPTVPFNNLKNAEAIYKFLNSQATDLKTYGTNPLWQVVDGPYKIQTYDPATSATDFVVNPSYSGPAKPHITNVDEVSFTSEQAEFDQLLTGKLDVGNIALSNLPEVPQLKSKGYTVYGYPEFFFGYVPYNFKDTTGSFDKVIGQLYIRQVLAHLQDQQAEIKSRGVFDGAGAPSYGPIPAVPVSQFTPKNALSNPYPFSISTAKNILTSHGWKVVPNGTTTCARPGSGPRDCGAGIPAGTKLSWNLYYSNNSPLAGEMDQAWVSNLNQVGIQVKLIAKTFNFILTNYDDAAQPKNDNLWAMEDFGGFTIGTYPTTESIFNTTGSYNIGGFSNPQVDAAIQNSEFSSNASALNHELSLLTKLQPGLFQPNEDRLYAFKNTLSGPPSAFTDATQTQYSPEHWYFIK